MTEPGSSDTPRSEDVPDWVSTTDDSLQPEPQQEQIIESDEYPLRVLAGAGTGKTFTTVRKVEHLIESEGVPPDRILALTFTNNAADSMREKLNARLGAAGFDVDAYTYHSICNELLTDYACEAGIDPDFEIVSEAEKYAIVLDVLDEIEYRTVKPNVYGPDSYGTGAASQLLDFVGSMKRSGISPTELDDFLGPADRLYELADVSERVGDLASEHLGGRSVGTVAEGLPAVRTGLVELRDDVGAPPDSEATGVEESVRDFLGRLVDLCDALEAAFQEHEAGERQLPDAVHKLPKYLLGGYASGAPTGIPDDLDLELPERLEAFLDDCLAARDLTAGYAAYERELAARNRLDFDGLVVETNRLMSGDVGEEIVRRWDYVLCDEFQDTDRLQFDLVTSLVSDGRLFVVGDDDQAIYEWRGANVDNITAELEATYGDDLADAPLEENFRSRQPILDLANAALDRLDERQREKTLERVDEPEYEGAAVAVVEEADEEEPRARQLTTVVRNLQSGTADDVDRAYDPGEIALLVRNNDHATPILEAFDDAGIPYQVSGDLSTESVGVGTVVAYLKALARPEEDEVSWNRVLTMRYRLCEADLRRLNLHDDGLLAALLEAPLEEFEEPERVREARDHATTLLDLRDRCSLARLYRELKEVTDIDWYLSEQESRDLAELDDVVAEYGDDAVQPPLSPSFLESLQHYDSLLQESGSTPASQPDVADDAVDVMTIHKSKGLDFPVVLLPRLTADEWTADSRTYAALEAALLDGPEAAFAEDLVARDAREQRRVLHVGLTRAEDLLVLHGSSDDADEDGSDERTSEQEDDTEDPDPGRSMHDAVESVLPQSIPWRPASGRIQIWHDLQASLPPGAIDWTDSLADRVVGELGGRVTHDGDVVPPDEARDRVLDIAERALSGSASVSTDEPRIQIEELTGRRRPMPRLRHSYTSLSTYEECAREHYLDHVVNAFEGYSEASSGEDGTVSQREIGLLFHDTAELAAKSGATTREEWKKVCERVASQQRVTEALPAAKECIDRYFALEIADWTVVDAEREFEFQLDGHTLVGFIDAVYRTPEDELVVVDYKATEHRRDIDTNRQLPLYLLACRDLYDEPVERAGYAFVGEIGPELTMESFDAADLEAVQSAVTTSMDAIADTTFAQYDAGDHCQWCDHSHLPCFDGGSVEQDSDRR